MFSGTLDRATRLVTPGGESGSTGRNACATRGATESATENQTAGGVKRGGIAQGNLGDADEMLATFGKGEKVG